MNNMYEITPLDTLFFRGSTPMEAGQYNTVSIFPPPVSVIKGAFWTEYCNINNKPYSEGLKEDGSIPIEVTGIFIKKDNRLYVPCPATWYYDNADKILAGKDFDGIKICKAQTKTEVFNTMGISTSAGNVVFVTPETDAKPLTGNWISIEALKTSKNKFSKDDILLSSDIYTMESRTGVGLDSKKHTLEGALYTSTHVRLHQGITIAVTLESEKELNLGKGKFCLGGEKRLSEYKKIDNKTDLNNNKSDASEYLSLAPIEATEDNLNNLISSGKLMTVSGWDLKKGFHKPSTSYIPAGAVFSKKINNSCIPMV